MTSINLKDEYRADPWDYLQPQTFPGWFLAKRGRGGMAEKAEFNTRAKAEKTPRQTVGGFARRGHSGG